MIMFGFINKVDKIIWPLYRDWSAESFLSVRPFVGAPCGTFTVWVVKAVA